MGQDYLGCLLGPTQLHSALVKRRSRIGLILAAGLVACALSVPPPVSSAGSVAASAKKCKKRSGNRRGKCKQRHRPALSVSPPGHDFGTIGYLDSAPLDFVVTNAGGRASGTPVASLNGLGARYFRINGTTCTAPLAPRATCTVTVQSAGNDGSTGTAILAIAATPGGTASAMLIVNIY
jgi:hypothetical protein